MPATPLGVQAEGSNAAPASPVTGDGERSLVVSLQAAVPLHHSPEAQLALNSPRKLERLTERLGTERIRHRSSASSISAAVNSYYSSSGESDNIFYNLHAIYSNKT